jgi:hypothetical protein
MRVDKHSRHIPAELRRTVWARDGGRCRFEGPQGRCSETGLLEFNHVVPYAAGGATTADNLELRCAAHNRYESEQYFGQGFPMFVREERGIRNLEWRSNWSGSGMSATGALDYPDLVLSGYPDQDTSRAWRSSLRVVRTLAALPW